MTNKDAKDTKPDKIEFRTSHNNNTIEIWLYVNGKNVDSSYLFKTDEEKDIKKTLELLYKRYLNIQARINKVQVVTDEFAAELNAKPLRRSNITNFVAGLSEESVLDGILRSLQDLNFKIDSNCIISGISYCEEYADITVTDGINDKSFRIRVEEI